MAGAAERTLSSSRIRQARRRQLVEAAIACIAEHGLAETTLSAVTTRAGLSHGLANFHFESKDALLSETLGHLAEEHHAEWRRALDSAGPAAADRLSAVIAADFAPAVCTPERLAVWFAFWGQATHRPLYLEVHQRHDAARRALLRQLCAEIAQGAGCGDAKLDPARIARSIEALIDGLWLQILLYPDMLGREEAHASAMDFLATLFPTQFAIAAPDEGSAP